MNTGTVMQKQSLYYEEMDLLSKQMELLNDETLKLLDRCEHFLAPEKPCPMAKSNDSPKEPDASEAVTKMRSFQDRINIIRERITSINDRIFQ